MAAGGPGFLSGWRGLGRFWMIVLAALGFGAVILQALGPPQPAHQEAASVPQPVPEPPRIVHPDPTDRSASQAVPAEQRPGRDTPGPVADPEPGLLEPDPLAPDRSLPCIAVDGRAPMHAYAAGFDPTTTRPRIGILVAGIGMNEAD